MLQAIRFSYTKDNATSHLAKDIIKRLQQETLDFISPHLWQSNIPDLNPVDYKVRAIMQQSVMNVIQRLSMS